MQKHCGRSKLNQPLKKDCWWWCNNEIWRNGCDVMTTSIEPVQAGTHQSLGWQVVQSGAQMYCKQRWVVHCKQSSQGKLSRVGHRCAASRDAEQKSTASRVEMYCKQSSGGGWCKATPPSSTFHLTALAAGNNMPWSACNLRCNTFWCSIHLGLTILWSLFWTSLWSSIHFEHLIV